MTASIFGGYFGINMDFSDRISPRSPQPRGYFVKQSCDDPFQAKSLKFLQSSPPLPTPPHASIATIHPPPSALAASLVYSHLPRTRGLMPGIHVFCRPPPGNVKGMIGSSPPNMVRYEFKFPFPLPSAFPSAPSPPHTPLHLQHRHLSPSKNELP